MEQKREFTGVFIPAKIWLDETMTPAEKMILAEVNALSEKSGWCNANNQHFADWLHCTPQNVSMFISRLRSGGKMIITYQDSKTFQGRKMQVNKAWYYGSRVDNPLSQTEGGLSQTDAPLSQTETEIQSKDKLNYSSSCIENFNADYRVKEGFAMSRKIPAAKYESYLQAWSAEITATGETHNNHAEAVKHFLNFSAARYRIEQGSYTINNRQGQSTARRAAQAQPEPAGAAYKPYEL